MRFPHDAKSLNSFRYRIFRAALHYMQIRGVFRTGESLRGLYEKTLRGRENPWDSAARYEARCKGRCNLHPHRSVLTCLPGGTRYPPTNRANESRCVSDPGDPCATILNRDSIPIVTREST